MDAADRTRGPCRRWPTTLACASFWRPRGSSDGFLSATCYGTPDQIIEKYRARRELLGDFEAAPAFRFGGIPFEEAKASVRLFAEEVIPELKRWS